MYTEHPQNYTRYRSDTIQSAGVSSHIDGADSSNIGKIITVLSEVGICANVDGKISESFRQILVDTALKLYHYQ